MAAVVMLECRIDTPTEPPTRPKRLELVDQEISHGIPSLAPAGTRLGIVLGGFIRLPRT